MDTPLPSSSFKLESGAEPIPGYRLERLLGKGNYGEVWKALGPADFPVALKFVILGEEVGTKELRSLEVLRTIKHPNLVATFGAWQLHGYLIIAMELATGTLLDRCKEAQALGLSGIPRDELFEYLDETAKALDYLNSPNYSVSKKEVVSVRHCDVKPHNILVIGNGVKVVDFGLAQIIADATRATRPDANNALTPSYAAPEFFNNETAPNSDQYSLAVTYCHLRAGQVPFRGTLSQIMAGHLKNPPDLTMLHEEERPVLARALAKKSDKRWPSCREFVKQLRECIPREFSPPRPPISYLNMVLLVLVVACGLSAGFLAPHLLPSRNAVVVLLVCELLVSAGFLAAWLWGGFNKK